MIARQNDQNSFTPEWGGFAIEGLRVTGDDAHVGDAVAERGCETRSRSLDGNELDLRE